MAEQQQEENRPQKEIGELKPGDQMIHIYVEKAKELAVPANGTVNPMVEVEIMGEKAYSSSKDSVTSTSKVSWMEHIFIEPRGKSKMDLENASIAVRVLDKGMMKDVMIGQYEFDYSNIYFMDNHTMLHQWMALSNPSGENFSDVTGYLKVCISIASPGDKQVLIEDDPNPDSDDAMMPACIKPSFKQMEISLFRASNLPKLDTNFMGGTGSIDAYVKYQNGKKILKSKVVTMANEIVDWNQKFLIPIQTPVMAGKLRLEVWDEDKVNDEIAGSVSWDLKKLINRPTGIFFWKNIYGAPVDTSVLSTDGFSDIKNAMNRFPAMGTTWKGRILMKIDIKESDNPVFDVQKIEQEEVKEAAPHLIEKDYQFIAEIGSLIVPPQDKKKYSIEIAIGEKRFNTGQPLAQGLNYNRWNKRFAQDTIKLPYVNLDDIGTIFVYLMDGKTPICYARFKALDFTDPNPKTKWIQFMPDSAQDKVKDDHKAGIFSFKMSLAKGDSKSINYAEHDAWKGKPSRRPKINKVRAYIYQCKDLPPADEDGSADPYVEVWENVDNTRDGKKAQCTAVVNDTTSPMYFQCMDLFIEGNSVAEMPPFVLDIYDKDTELLDSSDDFMTRAIIPTDEAAIKIYEYDEDDDNKPPEPKWHDMRFKKDGPPSGKILVAFAIAPDDFDFNYPAPELRLLGDVVPFDEYIVDINVLGLRNLHSSGLLPVKKATIEFNLESLIPPNMNSNVSNLSTDPGPPGPNPTINTSIQFRMILPKDELYCPSLACKVNDNIFKGVYKQLIGVFEIPIGQIMRKKLAENLQELTDIKILIQELKKIEQGTGVQTYNSARQKSALEDEGFAEMQKKQKQDQYKAYKKAGGKGTVQEAGKRVKKPQSKPSAKVEQQVNKSRQQKMKKPLLHDSEGALSDDDETQTQEIQKHQKQPYNPPKLDVNKVNNSAKKSAPTLVNASDSEPETPVSKRSARALMSKDEKIKQNEQVMNQVINKPFEKQRTVSKNAPDDVYEPISTPRRTKAEFEDALKDATGTPKSSNVKLFDQLGSGMKQRLEDKLLEETEKRKREEMFKRKQTQHEFEATSGNACKNIIDPEYAKDERLNVWREVNKPPKEIFVPLGWDPKPTEEKVKHYRRFYSGPLEHTEEVMSVPSVFDSFEIKRGQTRGASKGLLDLFKKVKTDVSGEIDTVAVVGKFKGIVLINTPEEKKSLLERRVASIGEVFELVNQIAKKSGTEIGMTIDDLDNNEKKVDFRQKMIELGLSHLNILKSLTDVNSEEIMNKMLLNQIDCMVRVYILNAHDLQSRDLGSASDPYVVVRLGNSEFNDRENYVEDEPNPDIYKCAEFAAKFPGCPMLEIAVYDWDLVFGDDLIGSDFIDLEDRYFSPEWSAIDNKPVEYRPLMAPSSCQPQGHAKCFVEIIPQDQLEGQKKFDIAPKPAEEMEIRVVVWDTKDLPMMDDEGTTDGFIKCFFDTGICTKETDTHYRNQNGNCNFNYRLLFRIKHPMKVYDLTVQAFDRDFFKSNDLIGENIIPMKHAIIDAELAKRPISITKDYYEEYLKPECKVTHLTYHDDQSFWVELKNKNDKGQIVTHGSVRLQIDVYPKVDADNNPVGDARCEPNQNPYLPMPAGRLQFSLNPCKMLNQLVDRKTRCKLYCCVCGILACMLLIFMFPMIFSDLISSALTS